MTHGFELWGIFINDNMIESEMTIEMGVVLLWGNSQKNTKKSHPGPKMVPNRSHIGPPKKLILFFGPKFLRFTNTSILQKSSYEMDRLIFKRNCIRLIVNKVGPVRQSDVTRQSLRNNLSNSYPKTG